MEDDEIKRYYMMLLILDSRPIGHRIAYQTEYTEVGQDGNRKYEI